MSTKMMVTAGVCAAALIAGASFAMSGGKSASASRDTELLTVEETLAASATDVEAAPLEAIAPEPVKLAAAPRDCGAEARAQSGFDPAATPYPAREDAGNRQVLKGAAVGAAVGAVGGELISDRAGIGAAIGAGAGALGGVAVKKSKQNAADERYQREVAVYEQGKASYEATFAACAAA